MVSTIDPTLINNQDKEGIMAEQSLSRMRLYWVEMPGELKRKWFHDRDLAMLFAQCLYNADYVIMNQHPIFERWLDLQPESISKFLNEMKGK
tara:strand:- start:248 stop:523 length:276 start_codon:yes stop_codon:yes gene_type:complete